MSKIEWTKKTWNPTTGCTHFSPECKNCYAESMHNRLTKMGRKKYAKGFDEYVMHPDTLDEPYKWKKPTTVFVNSMSDLFHEKMTMDFLKKIFQVMHLTPQHIYQVLTKRDRRLVEWSKELKWPDNVWMCVSVGTQHSCGKIQRLVDCDAKHKFLSIEPFIGEITNINLEGIDWVIVGGESGPGARPVKKEWVEFIQKKCTEYKVPFFLKQWGTDQFNPDPEDPTIHEWHRYHAKGGCMLNGKVYWSNPTIPDFEVPEINLFGKDHYIMDEVDDLITIWELKSYLPFADKSKFKELKDDIRKNGVIDPVLYWKTPNGEKLVIEGHTRMHACMELNKKGIPQKELKEDFKDLHDIKLWMVKHQLQRRNLTTTERVNYAYTFKETLYQIAKQNLSKAGKKKNVKPIDTNLEIAKLAGVGRTTVTRYDKVMSSDSEDLKKRLVSGKLTIGAASELLKKRKTSTVNKSKPKLKKSTQQTEFIEYQSRSSAHRDLRSGKIDLLITSLDDKTHLIKTTKPLKIGYVKISLEDPFMKLAERRKNRQAVQADRKEDD